MLFSKKFTFFLNIALKVVFFILLLGCVKKLYYYFLSLDDNNMLCLILLGFGFILIISFFIHIELKKKDYKRVLIIILIVAFILRILWIIFVDTRPTSDFSVMYKDGEYFANGNFTMFKDKNYIARFPFMTMTVVYFGILQKIFLNALMPAKIINVLLSTLNVYLVFVITKEIFNNEQKSVWAAFIACIFPPFIIYNSVMCSENLAMPFFLASVYVFLLVIKKNKNIWWLIFCGSLLSIGNLFRMVGYVIVIAYILYLLIYNSRKKLIKSIMLVLLSFLILLLIVNCVLLNLGITEYSLWKGSEPSITSVLTGTNLSTYGSWNQADSKIPGKYNNEYNDVEKASLQIIKNRLTKTPPLTLLKFYEGKFLRQWSIGDFDSVLWATIEVGSKQIPIASPISTFITFYAQLLYLLLILIVYIGLYNKKYYEENNIISLIYIIFCGYGLFYLLTEQQPRYAYIVSWLFIILAPTFDKRIFESNKNFSKTSSN